MAFVAPVLSGAVLSGAALFQKLKGGKNGELEAVKQQLRDALEALDEEQTYNSTIVSKCQILEEVNQHLEEQTSDLQHELETTGETREQLAEQVQQLAETCSTLQRSAGVLGVKNQELELLLAKQAKELADKNAQLAAEKRALEEKLAREQREHAVEKRRLLDTVDHLEREKERQRQQLDEEQKEFVRQMEELRQQVSGLLTSFFQDELSESEVAQKLKDLGLEVQLLENSPTQDTAADAAADAEAPGPAPRPKVRALPASLAGNPVIDPTWAFQPKLVLDCPERMQRLVAACFNNPAFASKPAPLQPLSANRGLNRVPSTLSAAAAPKNAPKVANEPTLAAPAPEPTPKPRPAGPHAPAFTIAHTNTHQLVISAKAAPNPQPLTAPPTPAAATGPLHSLFRSFSVKEARTAAPAAEGLPQVTMARQSDEPTFKAPTMDLARAT